MPLPLTVSCFGKIQIGFTFLIPAHLGSPGQRAVKRVCVAAVVNSSTQFVTAVWIVLNLTAASLDAGFCCCGRTAIFWRTSVTSWKQFDTRRTTLRTSLPADNHLPTLYTHARTERHCADTIGTVPVPCGLAVSNAKILIRFSIKIYGSNFMTKSTRKLLLFEITKMLIAVWEKKYCAIYCNFSAHFRCLWVQPSYATRGTVCWRGCRRLCAMKTSLKRVEI